jgi:hypothetical protein
MKVGGTAKFHTQKVQTVLNKLYKIIKQIITLKNILHPGQFNPDKVSI